MVDVHWGCGGRRAFWNPRAEVGFVISRSGVTDRPRDLALRPRVFSLLVLASFSWPGKIFHFELLVKASGLSEQRFFVGV